MCHIRISPSGDAKQCPLKKGGVPADYTALDTKQNVAFWMLFASTIGLSGCLHLYLCGLFLGLRRFSEDIVIAGRTWPPTLLAMLRLISSCLAGYTLFEPYSFAGFCPTFQMCF